MLTREHGPIHWYSPMHTTCSGWLCVCLSFLRLFCLHTCTQSHERVPTFEKAPTPYFWPNFLYRVDSLEWVPTLERALHGLMDCTRGVWEAQPQAPSRVMNSWPHARIHVSAVRHFIGGYYKATLCRQTLTGAHREFTVTELCCVPSRQFIVRSSFSFWGFFVYNMHVYVLGHQKSDVLSSCCPCPCQLNKKFLDPYTLYLSIKPR